MSALLTTKGYAATIGGLLLLIVSLLGLQAAIQKWLPQPVLPESLKSAIPQPQLPNRPIDTTGFSQTAYVIPFEPNGEGPVYSPRAEIRGRVDSWRGDRVNIQVAQRSFEVIVPGSEIPVFCLPEFVAASDGAQLPTSEVYYDFSRSQPPGVPVPWETLQALFPAGEDIITLVNNDKYDSMRAFLVVGFGCVI